MDVGFLFLFISFLKLLTCSMEVPIEGSTLPPEPEIVVEHEHGSHIISSDDKSKHGYHGTLDENFDHRFNHSRMLTLSTTLGYDEWWFLTTKRPQLSLKDFPGRPGVATWKEISSSSSTENRKSRNMNGPRAAGVSSGSWSFASNCYQTQMIWIIFLIFCFCWT